LHRPVADGPIDPEASANSIREAPVQISVPRPRLWALRDWLAAALLFVATAAFVLWQNSHIAVLWDLGYLLDSSYRIALGQIPYRDFPLAHAPLTFLVQAAIIHCFGRLYWPVIGYTALAGGSATVLTWRILLRTLRSAETALAIPFSWPLSVMLASPLVFLGVYSVYPHPIYDSDCAIAVLFAFWLLQRLSTTAHRREFFLAGAACVLPLFFKQNIGLPFLAAIVLGVAILLVIRLWRPHAHPGTSPAFLLLGITAAMALALAIIQLTAGLGDYLHWTVTFAAQRRLPGLSVMVGVYQQQGFAWMLVPIAASLALLLVPALCRRKWSAIAGLSLLAAPFLWTVIALLFNNAPDDRADSLLALWPMLLTVSAFFSLASLRRGITLACLLPLFVLAAIHGAFLSQQLWGSSYAIWPLLMLLIAIIAVSLPAEPRRYIPALGAILGATLFLCGSLYAMSRDRVSYVRTSANPDQPAGPPIRSTLPVLAGMATPGPYLPDFEELARFVSSEIPTNEPLLILPGEGPFYYATGRAPLFPVLLFDPATDPYSPQRLIDEICRRNVRWMILKRRLQLTDDPTPMSAETLVLLQQDFVLYRALSGYDIYRRLSPPLSPLRSILRPNEKEGHRGER
jgi:hypothetical protein